MDDKNYVQVVAHNYLREGELKNALPLYKELIEKTRKEDGCIKYELAQDINDENHVAFIEVWESQEALNKHFQTEHLKTIPPQIAKFAAKEKNVTIFKKIL